MGIKKFKPVTPGTRFRTGNSFTELTTGNNPVKSLTAGKGATGGRNHDGKMTMRQIGGGHKKKYRVIDFKRDKENVPGKIATIEYDPNRTGLIGLAVYRDGEKRYVLLPKNVKVGEEFLTSENAEIKRGNRLAIKNIPVGAFVYNVELKIDTGSKPVS